MNNKKKYVRLYFNSSYPQKYPREPDLDVNHGFGTSLGIEYINQDLEAYCTAVRKVV